MNRYTFTEGVYLPVSVKLCAFIMVNGPRKPKEKDITVGAIVPIVDREGTQIGVARLIRRRPSPYVQDRLPYILPGTTKHIWSYERWEVEWISHPFYRTGDRTCTEVNFYVRTTADQDSFVNVTSLGGRALSQTGIYVFMEIDGVMVPDPKDPERFAPHCVQGLRRVKKTVNGDIVVYAHNKHHVRDMWDLSKIPFRILDFLPTHVTFGQAVTDFLEDVDWEDFVVLTGDSRVTGPNVKQCGPNGLKLLTYADRRAKTQPGPSKGRPVNERESPEDPGDPGATGHYHL